MASVCELKVIIFSARGLKNVNWRHGRCRPYVVAWFVPNNKCSTRVDEEGDTSPFWDQALYITLSPGPIEDQTLYIDVVHAGSEDGTRPLIGSARLNLRDVLDGAGFGEPLTRNLQLKRPSGRPQGEVKVEARVRELPYRAPPYGVRPGTRVYAPPAHASLYPPLAGGYAYGVANPPPQRQYGYFSEGTWKALAVGAGVGLGAAAGYVATKWFTSLMDEILTDTDEDEDESEEEEEEEGIVDAAEEDEDGIVDDAAVEEELDYDD